MFRRLRHGSSRRPRSCRSSGSRATRPGECSCPRSRRQSAGCERYEPRVAAPSASRGPDRQGALVAELAARMLRRDRRRQAEHEGAGNASAGHGDRAHTCAGLGCVAGRLCARQRHGRRSAGRCGRARAAGHTARQARSSASRSPHELAPSSGESVVMPPSSGGWPCWALRWASRWALRCQKARGWAPRRARPWGCRSGPSSGS